MVTTATPNQLSPSEKKMVHRYRTWHVSIHTQRVRMVCYAAPTKHTLASVFERPTLGSENGVIYCYNTVAYIIVNGLFLRCPCAG